MPEFNEIHIHQGDDWKELPEPTSPYYVIAHEGIYAHRGTAIGNELRRVDKPIEGIGKLGKTPKWPGHFDWKGPKFPSHLISQAHDYFRRIYVKHGTEAELIITRRITDDFSGEFKLFVPYQRANGAGVKSIFEPSHIDHDFLVVGSIHSHCMMGAFHSGTDTGDGSDMDGLHFTIGMVTQPVPQIVAMVMMSGDQYHYRPPSDIAEIRFYEEDAPEWWDDYLMINPPKEIPKTFKTLTQDHWDEFLGVRLREVKTTTTYPSQWQAHHGAHPGGWNAETGWKNNNTRRLPSEYKPNEPLRESREFNQMTKRERKAIKRLERKARESSHSFKAYGTTFSPGPDGVYRPENFDPRKGGFTVRKVNDTEGRKIDLAIDQAYESNTLIPDDFDGMKASEMDDITHWQRFFANKMLKLADVLETLDMKADISISPKTMPKQLPGQMSLEDQLKEIDGLIEANKKLLPAKTTDQKGI